MGANKEGTLLQPLKSKLVPKLGASMLAGVLLTTSFASAVVPALASTPIVAQAADTVEPELEESGDAIEDSIEEETGAELDSEFDAGADLEGDDPFADGEDSDFSDGGSEGTGTGDVAGSEANSGAGGTTDSDYVEVTLTSDDANALGSIAKSQSKGVYDVIFKPDVPSKYEDKKSLVMVNSNNGTVKLNRNAFEWGTDASVKDALSKFVKDLQNSKVSEQGQQAIFDTWSEADSSVNKILIPITIDRTSADIYTAMKWLNPFLPIIRVVLGVGAIAIIILLILSTVLDLAFIGMPIMRERIDSDSGGDKKPIPFVSTDAVHAVKTTYASLDEGYKNAYFTYLKNRIWTYILLSICVLYLVLGELSGLIAWLLTLGDGIVQG